MSRILVFDIGDTLVPSRRFVEKVIEDELRQRNHEPVHRFDPDKFKMYDPKEIRRYMEKYEIQGDPEKIARKCRERYLDAFEDLMLENGVFDTLSRCNESFGKVGFISDNTIRAKNLLEKLLQKHGVDYDTVVVSDELGVEKPDPKIFRAFLDRRGQDAEDFVYVGNDVAKDSAAKEIGMEFIWTKEFDVVNSEYDGITVDKLSFENIQKAMERLERGANN